MAGKVYAEKEFQSAALQGKVFNDATVDSDTDALSINETKRIIQNPNLLINSGFQVWQRGDSFNNDSVYTADRWLVSGNTVSVFKNNAGIAINAPNDGVGLAIMQHIETNCIGKTMTMSFEYSTNTGSVKVEKTIAVSSQIVKHKINDNCVVNLHYDESTGTTCYRIYLVNINTVLKWCKLEYGEIATPFVPKPYAEELMLCQRYFQFLEVATPIVFEYGDNSIGYSYLIEPRFMKMRTTPTIASDIHYNYYNAAGNNVSGLCIGVQAYNGYLTARTAVGGNRVQEHCFGVKMATTLDAEIY